MVNLAYSQDSQSQNDHEKSQNSLMPALLHGYCMFAMHCGKIIFVDLLSDDLAESGKINSWFFYFLIWKRSQICIYPDVYVLRAAIREQLSHLKELYVLSAHCTQSGLVLSGDFLTTNGCSMIKFEKG